MPDMGGPALVGPVRRPDENEPDEAWSNEPRCLFCNEFVRLDDRQRGLMIFCMTFVFDVVCDKCADAADVQTGGVGPRLNYRGEP